MHEQYMLKCLELAEKGFGQTKSNPMVGCLVVAGNQILASGFHRQYGSSHAEVEAINGLHDKSVLADATIYVSLEPCSHFGKTPPCADFLISSGVKKVVIACQDPNPNVAGQGIDRLKQAGLQVIVGVCEQQARYLNKRFFTFHEKQRPWIILKWAQSSDGYIGDSSVPQLKISSDESKKMLHKFRSEEMSILIGTNTAIQDNPLLTARTDYLTDNPLRIVLDRELKIPINHLVFNDQADTIVFSEKKSDKYPKNVEIVELEFSQNLEEKICRKLWQRKVNSCIVEGGAITIQHWLNKNLFDEVRVFVSPQELKQGVKAPVFDFKSTNCSQVGIDKLYLSNNSEFIR